MWALNVMETGELEIRSKSLQELEPIDLNMLAEDSALAGKCVKLSQKRLGDFTVEDLRLMITQNLGLNYLIPLALEHLEVNPFSAGDYYPGDLLNSVLNVDRAFWKNHQELYWEIIDIASGLQDVLQNLHRAIIRFQSNDEQGVLSIK